MSSIKLISINSTGTYHAGNTVYGIVRCYLHNNVTVKAIKIKLTGKEKTGWIEERKRDYITHRGKNKFLFEEYNLLSSEVKLSPGMHNYPFSFTLPKQIPSTFETQYGKIIYKVKAIVSGPWMGKHAVNLPLKILSPVDLNTIEGIGRPLEGSDEKYMCSCCKSGLFTLTVNLPRTGYVFGENIPFSVHVENFSNIKVRSLKFILIQELIIKATLPSSHKEEINNLGEVSKYNIGAYGDYVFRLNLSIINDSETLNFINCSLFKVKYYLKCIAVCPVPYSNLSFRIPVTLGHIGQGRLDEVTITFGQEIIALSSS